MHVHYLFPYKISYTNCNGALIIAIRPRNKYSFHFVLRFKKRNPSNKVRSSRICYYTQFQYSKLSGASGTPTSQVRDLIMIELLIVGNESACVHVVSSDMIKTYSAVLELKHTDTEREEDMTSIACVHFVQRSRGNEYITFR